MPFRSELRIRFGDEDHAGLVYYPRFFDFFHRVFEDFFDAHASGYRRVLDEDRTGWPAVRCECDFRKPVRFGDVLVVDMRAERLGTSSATFHYRAHRKGDAEAEVAVEARITVACVDMATFTAKPIPAAYRALFETHAAP